jgi:hypothetical protein
MKNIIIFVAGAVVGAAVGTTVTVLAYQKEKKKWIEAAGKEDPKPATHEDAIVTDREEMRSYYIEQLRDLGFDVYDSLEDDIYDNSVEETSKSRVNPIDYEEDEDTEEIEEGDDSSPIEPNPDPYEIPSHEFGNKEFYEAATLQFYKLDKVMTDDNYDFVDDWTNHIGHLEERLSGEDKDAIYIRNEVEQTDYEVLIFNDSYAHAIEGEETGDMAD